MFYGLTDAEKRLSFTLIRLKKICRRFIISMKEVTSHLPSLEELEADVERLPLRDLQWKIKNLDFLKNQNDSVIIQYILLSSI